MSNTRQMTPEQMALLADIFRVLVKEIRSDEDKEKLAPGELGISYVEGCFYIKDPYTGELFSPNSVQMIKQIMNNYNPVTGEFNADRVNHIRFYTSISQLTQIGISLDADTIIRQMTIPSVLYAPITYENYDKLMFPSEKGLMTVVKISEEFVRCSYSDLANHVEYDGIYNSEKHLFEGWLVRGSNTENDNGDTTSGGTTINIEYGKPYYDMTVIVVRVNYDILPGAMVSVDGKTALPLVDVDGNPLAETIPANTIIMLIYDDKRKAWIYCNPLTDDVQSIINKILADRITGVTVTPGVSGYLYTVPVDNTTSIFVNGFNKNTDILFVNFGQTLLRPDIDYRFDDTAVNMIHIINNIKLIAGETLYFQIVKFNVSTNA